jgi:hypothetical protein
MIIYRTPTKVGTKIVDETEIGNGKILKYNAATDKMEYVDETTGGEEVVLTLRLDDVGGGVTYVGEAEAGSAEGSAVWRIKKIIEVGADITILYKNGNTNFDNIWSDHLVQDYS